VLHATQLIGHTARLLYHYYHYHYYYMLSNEAKMNSVRCPKPLKEAQKRRMSKIKTIVRDKFETVRDRMSFSVNQ